MNASKRCDKSNDCGDMSDEEGCGCAEDEFQASLNELKFKFREGYSRSCVCLFVTCSVAKTDAAFVSCIVAIENTIV